MESPPSDLLKLLEAFQIDEPGVAMPFSERLARENGWFGDYARRVVKEYKRFVYLAFAAGHPVTPSEEVDQAWHLHLCYTESYWKKLCGELLGRPLHHGPTKGGAAELEKHRDWYQRTLTSYERLIGAIPPADIWPSVERRFGRIGDFVRVDTRRYWIIPKPWTL